MSKLFVYGIFLNKDSRERFNMTNPEYCTVRGYATKGGQIVSAVKDDRYTLTGLLVDIPDDMWGNLDSLERGYDRIVVETTSDVWDTKTHKREPIKAYMYVQGERYVSGW